MPHLVIIAAELNGGSATNIDPGFKKLAELKPAKLTVFWTDWAPLHKSGDATIGNRLRLLPRGDEGPEISDRAGHSEGERARRRAILCSVVNGTKNQELAEAFLNQIDGTREAAGVLRNQDRSRAPSTRRSSLPPTSQAAARAARRIDQLRFFDPEIRRECARALDRAPEHRGRSKLAHAMTAAFQRR